MRQRFRLRPLDLAAALLVLAGALWLIARWPGERGEVLGFARVVDGDSLVVDGREIRLYGIDAPELAQTCERAGQPWPCGEAARQRLGELAGHWLLRCAVQTADRYGRLVSRCRSGEEDIARRMVEEGLAIATSDYAGTERKARAARRGLWAGTFIAPGAWRQQHPR